MGGPTLGENIRFYRKAKGWNQKQLGKAAGLTQRAISQIENNNDTLVSTIRAVATALHLEPEDLFRRTEVPRAEAPTAPETPRVEIPAEALQDAVLGALRALATSPAAERIRREADRRADQLLAEVEQEAQPDRQAPATGTRGPKRTRRRGARR